MAPLPPSQVFHESLVLKRRDRTIFDSNSWPDYTLAQATIIDPVSNAPTNLLYASDLSPVTVRGRLEKLSYERQLLPKAKLPVMIEATNVGLFSYGQYEEGEVALWAAGEAGWFEIKPSRAYRDIFKEMVQAVECLYFAADFYRDLDKSKMKKLGIDAVFEQYAAEPLRKCHGVNEAAELFRRHKRFLFSSMENGKEGIAWKQTQLYQWLLQEASEQVIKLGSETNGIAVKDETPNRRPPHAGKGKSTLRPQSGVLTIKNAKRRRSLDEEQDYAENDTMAGTADVTANGDVNITSESPLAKRRGRPRRLDRAARNQILQQQDVGQPPSPVPDESDTVASERPVPLLRRRPAKAPKPKAVVHIVETPLPSYEPQGPGDTWTCTFDGCSHRVYAASEADSRELIKEHFRGHALGAQAQIDLVYKEERPYLPIGNLIKKIRDMAAIERGIEAAGAGASGDGQAGWPSPVVRKY